MADNFETTKRIGGLVQILATTASIALMGIGLYEVALSKSTASYFMSHTGSWLFIVFGLLMMVIMLAGLAALAMGMRTVYVMQVGLLLVLSLAVLAVGVSHASTMDNTTKSMINDKWHDWYHSDPQVLQQTQSKLHCCGLKSPIDHAFPKNGPRACLDSKDFGYDRPCRYLIKTDVENHLLSLGISGIVISSLLLALLLAMYWVSTKWPTDMQLESGLLMEHERLLSERRSKDEQRHRASSSSFSASRESQGLSS